MYNPDYFVRSKEAEIGPLLNENHLGIHKVRVLNGNFGCVSDNLNI